MRLFTIRCTMAHEIRLAQVQPPVFASVVTQIVFHCTLYYSHNFLQTRTDTIAYTPKYRPPNFYRTREFVGKCARHPFNIVE